MNKLDHSGSCFRLDLLSIETKEILTADCEILLTDDQFKRADLNGDNVLSSSEALRILQYINGKVSTLEM